MLSLVVPRPFSLWRAKIYHVISLWTSMDVSMVIPPFTIDCSRVPIWPSCSLMKYLSSDNGSRMATIASSHSLTYTPHFRPSDILESCDVAQNCPRPIEVVLGSHTPIHGLCTCPFCVQGKLYTRMAATFV